MTSAEFIDNPNWAQFIPDRSDATKTRHLPAHEDCAPIDVAGAQAHLRAGGTLGAMPGYEERPGQIDMTGAIAQAFNSREHLMVEAGTGVGKSLAYLVPAVLWAATNDTPVIVSTATRNLQSQLINSDLPRARRILGDGAQKFKTALLKGRTNYLCLRAVSEFFAPGFWTMSDDEKALIPDFISWLQTTKDGDLDSYEGLPRSHLSCPGEECGGRRCPYYTKCFVYKARKVAADAHLIVVNHALVLAEATSPGSGILPSYGRLILDEAHDLESIATDYLSFEFSIPALTHILNRLSRRSKGKRPRPSGVLSSIERQLQKGALVGKPEGLTIVRLLADVSTRIPRTIRAAEQLAALAERLLRPAQKQNVCRFRLITASDGTEVRQYTLHGLFKPYESEVWSEKVLFQTQSDFESALADLVNLLHVLRDTMNEAVAEGEFNPFADLSVQLNAIADSLVSFANETNFVLRGEKNTHAYWVERVRVEKRPAYLRLVAAPLSVADDLRRIFYAVKDSVILSSATLRVGNDFRYMARRLGALSRDNRAPEEDGRFRFLTADSPFDYLRQALVLAPDCLPDPATDALGYAKSLADLLRDLFSATHGRALVLFTSYEMMNAVADSARAPLTAAGIDLLVQGEGLSRESMTRALKERTDTVLFGAQSFWEGVDVAGEALSCVVLTRLPFAQVGDPVIEARSEEINRAGGSSFRDYALPEAVIKFRQGFGRLIRTKADRGVVIITDPRLVRKNYGATFRKSIPTSVHTVTEVDDLLRRVADFF